MTRHYDVVARQFPIVYTLDGDVDPNGLLYHLAAYSPLLDFARAQWDADDELLPRLHRRRQLIQLVVDGLPRWAAMRERLATTLPADAGLLAETGGPEERAARPEPEDDGPDPHTRAVRQNYRATLDEVSLALEELTRGQTTSLPTDAADLEQAVASWRVALSSVEQAARGRLLAVDAALDALLASLPALAPGQLDRPLARRLLLNDRRSPAIPDEHAPDYDRFNPLRPIPVVRPLVLRACAGENVRVRLENQVAGRAVGLHLQGLGLGGERADGTTGPGVRFGDGGHVGANESTLAEPGGSWTYHWSPPHEGVWCLNDLGDTRGTEDGTNVHGLFGALVVEAPGSRWRDPETGVRLDDTPAIGDGLYVDVLAAGEDLTDPAHPDFVDFHLDDVPRSFREFTVFIHDEPEIHSGQHLVGEHTVMPLSYRAEPMPHRLPHRMRRYAADTAPEPDEDQVGVDLHAVSIELDDELGEVFWTARDADGTFLERVAGEEQHHSSWLFGDPITPILRAYQGDPARIRLVHAGVKETHVFHLHVHQWRAVPQDTAPPSVWQPGEHRGSQLLDSITIGPQTAQTIDPLYGSGSRQHAVGDVIWHCHLYPHFHHGMWGLWRSYDRFVDGHRAYPDGTPCPRLEPLPGRDPRTSDNLTPGFPWFIDAAFPQKSPPPPAIRDEDVVGRRQLLRLPKHSAKELAAFDPGCVANPHSGALFVDLDGLAETWAEAAGLPERRVVSYDVEVRADDVVYNSGGWHDPRGHHYRITGVEVATRQRDGSFVAVRHDPPAQTPPFAAEPFFPRANHGDVVELRFHNELGSFPADDFDLTTLPVECGLHVHLVKFDVLAADGSSTGWNYLAGASCREAVGTNEVGHPPRNVGLHRWVVDEEFGPCFFHDHLLANYRQKHGLFAALIAEPQGARWLLPDQATPAWSGTQAVVLPPEASGLPAYREACLAVGDFVPLYRADGDPINPPHELSGDDDPGAMGVNYRSAPLSQRGDDPSAWFSSADSDPDTPVLLTYPGERLRIRLVQGSHEEQHSFVTHGLRWRREWHHPASPLVNQQTLGISEAFTLDLDPADATPYGIGDHLWSFNAMDDLWVGCWGLLRALAPSDENLAALPPLPRGDATPRELLEAIEAARPTPPRPTWTGAAWEVAGQPAPVREYTVAARRIEHEYDGRALTDPWGLIYAVAAGSVAEVDDEGHPTGQRRTTGVDGSGLPLVLRAHPGEWLRVTLVNEVLLDDDDPDADVLLPEFGPEVSPPRLPIESTDDLGYPDERQVSPRVSLHASLLSYDVVGDDGAWVGHNHDGTVAPLPVGDAHAGHAEAGGVAERADHELGHAEVNWREYWWYADPALGTGTGQVCYLYDVADIRNHRHHGLVGAVVVEPADVEPSSWTGPTATLTSGGATVAEEVVLFLQDGLRHFIGGDPDLPVRDVVPDDDPEDSGQKGINYRSALVNRRNRMALEKPATPVFEVPVDEAVWVRLVCAADKPRNHTFTLHGVDWPFAPWVADGPWTSSISGLTAAAVHDLVVRPEAPGDHAYRSGAFRWAVGQGMWGLLRVVEP